MTADPHLRRLFEIGQHELFPIREEITDANGRIVERMLFETADGEAVRGLLTRPSDGMRAPAILYIHAHGNRYDIGADELLQGRPALQGPLGPVLAEMGLVTLAIDMPAFGGRAASERKRPRQGAAVAGQVACRADAGRTGGRSLMAPGAALCGPQPHRRVRHLDGSYAGLLAGCRRRAARAAWRSCAAMPTSAA